VCPTGRFGNFEAKGLKHGKDDWPPASHPGGPSSVPSEVMLVLRWKSGIGARFLQVLRFPYQFLFHQLLHIHYVILSSTLYSLGTSYSDQKLESMKIKTRTDIPAVVPFCPSSANNVLIHKLHGSCTPKLQQLNAVYRTKHINDILHGPT
jgi:hypothetical protein